MKRIFYNKFWFPFNTGFTKCAIKPYVATDTKYLTRSVLCRPTLLEYTTNTANIPFVDTTARGKD